MTKWEEIFKSHHPNATVESQLNNGPGGGRYYLVRKGRGAYMWVGQGNTKARAWADACEALRLDEVKT